MAGGGELVELVGLAAVRLEGVLGTALLRQPLERVALAGGVDEGDVARLDLGVAAVELELRGLAGELEALEPRLRGQHVHAARGGRGGGGGPAGAGPRLRGPPPPRPPPPAG